MPKAMCSIDGCEAEIVARQMCVRHYARWYRYGDPGFVGKRGRRAPKPPVPCSIEGCDRVADTRGWCSLHYGRWRVHGDPLTVQLIRRGPGQSRAPARCSEPGCCEWADTRGLCGRHYRKAREAERVPCTVDGCETTAQVSGLCIKHYTRKRSWGTTDDRPPAPLRGPCSVKDCGGAVKARNLCGMHLRRWYVYGSTELPTDKVRTRRCRFCKRTMPATEFTVAASACTACLPLHRAALKRITLPRTQEVRAREAQVRATQGDRCAICGIAEADAAKGRLHADHDHSGRGAASIRGMLCSKCNTGLGMFNDSPRLLRAAVKYLRSYPALPGPPDAQEPLFGFPA